MKETLLDRELAKLNPDQEADLFSRLRERIEGRVNDDLDLNLSPLRRMFDYGEEVTEYLKHPDRLRGLSTGYRSLDLITGGLDRSELVVVSGPTGHGKTLLAQNVLHNLALKDMPSLFVSLEMPPVQVISRLVGAQKSDDGDGLAAFNLPIWFWDGGSGISLTELRKAAEKSVREHGVKVILIDHLHYFARSITHAREETDLIVRSVKLLPRDLDLPVILVAHTRKLDSDTAEPQEVDLKDTSGIAQDADQVIMVWRHKTAEEEEDRRTLNVRVTKNRLKGKSGKTQLYIDKNWRLQEMTHDIFKEVR